MPQKVICIFDTSNNPLRMDKIRFELFDAATGQLLDTQLSADLNLSPVGKPSNEWGVRLKFNSGTNPLDVYTTDPNYEYPGNTIRYLEGRQQDRIDIDLKKLPVISGGQKKPLDSPEPVAISRWVDAGVLWNKEEKGAVRNLIFNYISVFVPQLGDLSKFKDLATVAKNWEETMRRVGVPVDILKKSD